MTFYSWPKIEGFHNVRKFAKSHPEILRNFSGVFYNSKIKLHGTNAAVQVHEDGTVVAQSRSQVITQQNDNMGFANWVKQNEDKWATSESRGWVVFGEWCGSGIQSGVAISNIDKKIFAVFAALRMDNDDFVVDPHMLSFLCKGLGDDVLVLPWHTTKAFFDFTESTEELQAKIDKINEDVLEIEKNDPWVKQMFGVDGVGEGLVFYPRFVTNVDDIEIFLMQDFANLSFKAKGEQHKNVKTSAPAQIDAAKAANAVVFADMVLTEARLMQGAHETRLSDTEVFSMKSLGKFLQWTMNDVQKETVDELDASNLTWKDVAKVVQTQARTWYVEKAKQ